MIATRGKYKGQRLKLHQAANDWISADTEDGKPVIINPISVQLESNEEWDDLVRQAGGNFWDLYGVNQADLRIVKRSHD